MTTPWQRLEFMQREHARTLARVRCAAGMAHLGEREARELALAQEQERERAAQLAQVEGEVEALRVAAVERARIVPPDRGDREVLDILDKLERRTDPAAWRGWLERIDDPAYRRALTHLAWLAELKRSGLSVEDWRRGVRLR